MSHGDKIKDQVKSKEMKRTFLRLISYMEKEKTLLVVIFFLIIITIISNLLGSYLLRPIINDYILPGNINGLIIMLLILLVVYLSGVLATFVEYRLLNRLGQRTVARLRAELFKKMETLPIAFFDIHQHGDLMSRYTNDMDRISDVLTDSLADLFSSLLMFAGIIALMIYISPMLTVVSLITLPLMLLSARQIVKKSKVYFQAQQNKMGETNGYIEEMISGQKVIKIFNHESKVVEEFEKLNQDLKDKSVKAQLYSGMMMPIMQNLNTINFVLISIVGAILAIFRGFDVGGLATFLQYSRQFGRPVIELASLYNNLQAAIAGAERIFNIIDEKSETDHDTQNPVESKDEKGNLVMKDVYFGYKPGKLILKGISLEAKPGTKIALVGATGAGKTTILNMLPRFYDIKSGEILIDGIPIQDTTRDNLRKTMAIVLQDTHLFSGTVYDNIRFGRLDATDEEVIAAAKLTAAHSFIKRLPQGYYTHLENDGANLSQGQRQLLNIARAAIANPVILLLDEATSNIDTRSEILIQQGLDKLMEGRTSLIIAHRLSTVKNADRILVLENGTIIEQGTHKELLLLKGKYYDLYKNQFEDL